MARATELTRSTLPRTWADAYLQLVQRYDEFEYLRSDDLRIVVDSEENFVRNYAGNWYYYFK
jgi:hypothetical protein